MNASFKILLKRLTFFSVYTNGYIYKLITYLHRLVSNFLCNILFISENMKFLVVFAVALAAVVAQEEILEPQYVYVDA